MRSSVSHIFLNIGSFLPLSLIDECFVSRKSISTVSGQPLERLTDSGMLTHWRRGSATRHQPCERLTGPKPGERAHSISVPRNQGSLPREPRSLGTEMEPARNALVQQLPGTLGMALGALGRRSRPDEVLSVILALLRHKSFRLAELGLLLDRNPEYVRQTYIQPLLEQGEAAMTRPETPNDPEQAYIAVESPE